MAIKADNKQRLAALVKKALGLTVDASALFDVQVKRIHEYKRQLMNILYCVHRYMTLKNMTPVERSQQVPRVTLIGGKAAPAYHMAKNIIKLINDVGNVVNNDPDIGDLFKVVFLPNYNVSNAEVIIPASDISQHISTAGMEASGTSNMKFAMNGCLILGTMDGANVEMAAEMGEENMFIFGARLEEIPALRHKVQFGGPEPLGPELAVVFDQLLGGAFGSAERAKVILDSLGRGNDYYLLKHDFKDYLRAQKQVDVEYQQKALWARKSIMCTAGMGKFSSDRTIQQYAEQIWGVEATPRPSPADAAAAGGRAPVRVRSFANFDPNQGLLAGEEGDEAVGLTL
jgi:starch phosphorylase